jgi:hypothetical protein
LDEAVVSGADTSPKDQLYKHVFLSPRAFSSSHRAKGPPKTHLIPEASVTMAMANLAAHGIGVDDDDEVEDGGPFPAL